MKTNLPELKVSKAIMQLEEINSVDAHSITTELIDFAKQDWFFVRGKHQRTAHLATKLISKLNHNATEALSEVESLQRKLEELNKNNSELSAEAVGLSHDKYELEKRIEEDAKTIGSSKTNYIALQKRFDTQTGALNRLNTALITSDEKYKVAVEEYKTLDAVNQELNNAIDNYDKTLAKTEKEVFDVKAASLEKEAENTMLNTRVKCLIIHVNELEAKAKENDNNVEYWRKKYETLCGKLEELAEQG